MTNQVTLTFGGDTKSLDRATQQANKDLGSLNKSLDDNARHAQHAGGQLEGIGENLDGSTKKFRGGKDVVDGMSDSLGALGVTLPGPIGNIAMMAGGLADLADGIATTVLPMLEKLWAVIMANPLIAIAALVIALGVGFYELYKHSERFRNAVNALWGGVKAAFAGILGAIQNVVGWVKDHWPLLLGILGGPFALAAVEIIKHRDAIWNAIKALPGKIRGGLSDLRGILIAPFRDAFNAIADLWNNSIGKLHFGVHKFGVDFDFGMPNLPHAANGGAIGGATLVGERGPELFVPNGAGRITSASNMAKGGSGTTVIQFVVDGKVITEQVYEGLLRKKQRQGALGL